MKSTSGVPMDPTGRRSVKYLKKQRFQSVYKQTLKLQDRRSDVNLFLIKILRQKLNR